MLKQKIDIKKICISAVLTALCYVVTIFVSIPISSTGYINLSDFFIVFTTIAIDPLCGLFVAGIAPALADLTLGYYVYIPFTIISKVLESLLCHLLFNKINNNGKYILIFLSGLVMALIYLIPDLIVLGFDQYLVGFVNVIFNTIQGIVGIFIALGVKQVFKKINYKIN